MSKQEKNRKAEEDANKNFDVDQTIFAQQEAFKHVVFSGGGVKGVAYSGVVEQLENSKVRDGLEDVAGSSAGALTASFIATGISAKRFKEIFKETNFEELAVGKASKGLIINQNTSNMQAMLRENIAKSVSESLVPLELEKQFYSRLNSIADEITDLNKKQPAGFKEKIAVLDKQSVTLADIISDPKKVDDLRDRAYKNEPITFSDLDMLHLINPKKFKGLSVTAVDKETGELVIFNAKNSPDVEIATACRASASIPRVFESVEINGRKYVDGGYRNNVPQHIYKKSDDKIQDLTEFPAEVKKAKTDGRVLVFAFGESEIENDPLHTAVYSSKEKIFDVGKIKTFLMDNVFKKFANVGGDFKFTQQKQEMYETIRENAQNTVILDTKITTREFEKGTKKREILHTRGKLATARYFDNYEIGQIDKNLSHKEFVLEVSERLFNKDVEAGKVNELVKYCHENAWAEKDKHNVISEFSAKAIEASPKARDILIEALNDKFTNSEVKVDYANMLNVELSDNIQSYKFSLDDLQKKFSPKEKSALQSEGLSEGLFEKLYNKFTDIFAKDVKDVLEPAEILSKKSKEGSESAVEKDNVPNVNNTAPKKTAKENSPTSVKNKTIVRWSQQTPSNQIHSTINRSNDKLNGPGSGRSM